ncbi:hypothetical protein OG285_36910 (plasmid) [Streptomyces sp. NBC_01471]|uniref:hypothetical protein n=1 Tax=Streptomyces sp. NBC_01471 TaxID=2903879 RepID=UPI002F90B22C
MTTQQAALDQITSLHTRLDFGDNAPDLAGEELARCYPEQVQVLRVAGMLDAAWLLAPRTPPIPPKAEHQVVNPKALPERGGDMASPEKDFWCERYMDEIMDKAVSFHSRMSGGSAAAQRMTTN